MALFGLALFPLYSCPRGDRLRASISLWLRTSLRGSAWLAFLSGLAWAWFSIVNMAGSVGGAVEPDAVRSVLIETSFGRVWAVRLMLIVGLLALMKGRSNTQRQRGWPIILVTGLLLLGVAFVGHT